jgi:hypothetical protein
MLVELCSPGCSSIGEQNVDLVRVLLHLFHQSLDFTGLGKIGGDGDGFAVAGESVEGSAGFFAGLCFAGCDD